MRSFISMFLFTLCMALEKKVLSKGIIRAGSKTQKWYSKLASQDSNPLIYFYRPPMIFTAYTSSRTLFIGTTDQAHRYLQIASEEKDSIIQTSCYISSFWDDFFNSKKFMDHLEERTIPSKMISTGFMELSLENQSAVFIGHFLKSLARKWRIPLLKKKFL